MTRLTRTLRLVAVAVPALLAAGTGLAQAAAGRGLEHDPDEVDRIVQSAEGGDAEAQLHLALMYARGFGGMEQSTTEALVWFRRSAEQGHGLAQGRLGDIYAYGEGGIRQDPVEADKWYRLAGRADTEVTVVAGREFTSGRAIGFHALMLGKMYQDGIAIPPSVESLARDLRPCFLLDR